MVRTKWCIAVLLSCISICILDCIRGVTLSLMLRLLNECKFVIKIDIVLVSYNTFQDASLSFLIFLILYLVGIRSSNEIAPFVLETIVCAITNPGRAS